MAKIDQEVKELKSEVSSLSQKIDRLQFQLVQILSKINEEGAGSVGSTAMPSAGPVSVDITPLEERLEQLAKTMVSKVVVRMIQIPPIA